MGRRALSLEEKRERARERSRKRRIQQLQKRRTEYQQDYSHYSTVRPINNINNTFPCIGNTILPGPG
jgi:hypothetical protein